MITLTDTAAHRVKELITAEGDDALALRVEVIPGGCSGFKYNMFFDTDIASSDVTLDQDGVRVVADSESATHLGEAILDYKDGLEDAGFAITNPGASHSCGCGKSFS